MAQAEQYFAAEPQSKDVRRKLHVTLRGNEADVEVSNGVFSGNRVALGTSVLLRHAPDLQAQLVGLGAHRVGLLQVEGVAVGGQPQRLVDGGGFLAQPQTRRVAGVGRQEEDLDARRRNRRDGRGGCLRRRGW